jgi:hypothetical protein
MVSPFRGDGPFRGRGPFLGRGPWAGRGPGGFNVGIPFAIDATGEHIRAAISDPTAYASGGYLLRGLGGARLNAAARSSVAMQQKSDGGYEFAAHNLLLNSATMATQTVTVVSGAAYTLSAFGAGSIATSGAAVATLTGTGADNRVTVTVTATTTSLVMTLTGAMDRAQLNLGPTALPYVPTTSAAVYAPAVDWLSAQSAYGLRSEAAATNSTANNTHVGAVAGTPGTAPTGWSAATLTGLTRELVGTGVANGLPYIDFRLSGTNGATLNNSSWIVFQFGNVVTAASTQSWTSSVFHQLIAGSMTGVTLRVRLSETDGTSSLANSSQAFTPTSTFTRTSVTRTLNNALTTHAQSLLSIDAANGLAIDFTVRLFAPQLETGSRASSPILTLGATATRAADALVVPDSGWISSTQGTLAADYVPSAAGTQLIVELDDATANERHSLTNDGIFTVVDGGVSQAAVDGGTPTVAARNKIAASYAVDAFAVALNGGAVVTDTSGTLPTVTRMDVNALDGHLTRIRYIGRRLSDGQLRALSV